MRDPEDDDEYDDDNRRPREDRLFGTGGFRRRLSEGLTGLLDPDGALGKGKDYVTGVTQATKTEVVRMISSEVRNFLDGMDTVDMLQRVIAGLVIDVKAEIRFSVDPQGQLKTSVTTKDTEVRGVDDKPRAEAKPHDAAKHDAAKHEATRHDASRHEVPRHDAPRHDAPRHDAPRHDSQRHEAAKSEPRVEVKPKPDKP